MSLSNRPRQGFSLVEIMIVVVIIGLLAGAVTLGMRSYMLSARQKIARGDIATVVKALNTFHAQAGRYPTNAEGLAFLSKPSEEFPEPLLDSGIPTDPWGRPYQYNCPAANSPFEVVCFGADGRPGGTGADEDISSEDLKHK